MGLCVHARLSSLPSMANLKIELSKLDSEAWPGALDVEKEKLMLIHEKEELLKELQFVTPQKRTRDELERLEADRQRLEAELLSVRGAPSRALAERWVSPGPGRGGLWVCPSRAGALPLGSVLSVHCARRLFLSSRHAPVCCPSESASRSSSRL